MWASWITWYRWDQETGLVPVWDPNDPVNFEASGTEARDPLPVPEEFDAFISVEQAVHGNLESAANATGGIVPYSLLCFETITIHLSVKPEGLVHDSCGMVTGFAFMNAKVYANDEQKKTFALLSVPTRWWWDMTLPTMPQDAFELLCNRDSQLYWALVIEKNVETGTWERIGLSLILQKTLFASLYPGPIWKPIILS